MPRISKVKNEDTNKDLNIKEVSKETKTKEPKVKETKESKKTKESKENKLSTETKESNEIIESNNSKETKDAKTKTKEVKDSKTKTKEPKVKESKIKEIKEVVVTNEDSDKEPDVPQDKNIMIITNPEFIQLKNKWVDLTKRIEELNKQRDILENEKNLFVTEMCKIIEQYQPKVNNLIDCQNTSQINRAVSSRLLDNNTDSSDSSDSDDNLPVKKSTKKKSYHESSEDDSDSD